MNSKEPKKIQICLKVWEQEQEQQEQEQEHDIDY